MNRIRPSLASLVVLGLACAAGLQPLPRAEPWCRPHGGGGLFSNRPPKHEPLRRSGVAAARRAALRRKRAR